MNKEKLAYHLTRFTKAARWVFFSIMFVGQIIVLILVLNLAKNTNDKVEQFPLYYPLKFDTPQNVLREPPIFHLDEKVDVQARFVNGTDKIVTVSAAVHWILVTKAPDVLDTEVDLVQPPLLLIIDPGCSRQPFSNTRPNSVALITEKLFSKGYDKVIWRLAGENVVTSISNSGSQRFEVDSFSYVPDDIPIPDNKIEQIPESCDEL
jgi:hypothetical protein